MPNQQSLSLSQIKERSFLSEIGFIILLNLYKVMIDSQMIGIYNNISMSQNDVRTIKCPFVPHHVMPYERFLSHLQKCQFPDKKNYSKCRFNPYHVYHMSALAEHEKKCPDQKKYQSYQDDDEDWGVEDVPQKSELNQQEQQYSNYGSSFSYSSEPKNNKAKKSDIGKKQQNSSKVTQKTHKTTNKKQFQAMDLDDFNPGKVINNTHFQAMDLDDFNPCQKK